MRPNACRCRAGAPPRWPTDLTAASEPPSSCRSCSAWPRHRAPVVFELLAPNGRPVQTTQDLRSFWTTTYVEVRKELRSRYPRHPWPEDPWTDTPRCDGRLGEASLPDASEHEALQVVRLRDTEQHRMIPGLHSFFDDDDGNLRIGRRRQDDAAEHALVDMC